MALHVVCGEVQTVAHVFPVGDQRCHEVIHGQIRVSVDLPPDHAEVPTTGIVGVTELAEVERLGGGYDEVVPDARVVGHVPVTRAREQHPIIPPPLA